VFAALKSSTSLVSYMVLAASAEDRTIRYISIRTYLKTPSAAQNTNFVSRNDKLVAKRKANVTVTT